MPVHKTTDCHSSECDMFFVRTKDEDQALLIRNKHDLVAKRLCSGRGIDLKKSTLHPVARLEAVSIFKGSLIPDLEKVYLLSKALYGLKNKLQEPGMMNFQLLMSNALLRFEMSLMGEMKFFLGLQIHPSPKGIFINQVKYALEILKKHNMDNCHSIGTPWATKPKLDVDLSREPVDQSDIIDSGFELTAFSDADHAGCIDTRKTLLGGITSSLVISYPSDNLFKLFCQKDLYGMFDSADLEFCEMRLL
ncbi:retrovirus-related pol polyprotein from transposon TNT 1-94 [Tanacetum coccineum]